MCFLCFVLSLHCFFFNFVYQGHENSVGQWCPTFLLGAFSYAHNTGSVVTCNTASNLDVCANWTTLTFEYTKCPTIQAFSGKCILMTLILLKLVSLFIGNSNTKVNDFIISMSAAEGTVDCLYTQTVGSVSYVSVLNKGTVDYSSYQRFTCLVRLHFFLKFILNRKHLSCEFVISLYHKYNDNMFV